MEIANKSIEATKTSLVKMGLFPNADVESKKKWTNGFCQHTSLYYPLDQCHPITPSELEAEKNIRRVKYAKRREKIRQARAWRTENIAQVEKDFYEKVASTAEMVPDGACLVGVRIDTGVILSYFAAESTSVGDTVQIDYLRKEYFVDDEGYDYREWILHSTLGVVESRMTKEDLTSSGVFYREDPLKSTHLLVGVHEKENPVFQSRRKVRCRKYDGYEACIVHFYPDGMRWATPASGLTEAKE